MAFISTVPLTFTTKLLSLPQGAGGKALYVRARVVRCTQIMGGFYDVGVQLMEPEPDALSELLALAERDCFVGSSLTAKPSYRWVVNGRSIDS